MYDTVLSLSAGEDRPETDVAKSGQLSLACHAGSNPDDPIVSASGGANGAARESAEGMAGNGGRRVSLLRWRKPEGDHMDSPFFYVDLPSDDVAQAIASRSEWVPAGCYVQCSLLERFMVQPSFTSPKCG